VTIEPTSTASPIIAAEEGDTPTPGPATPTPEPPTPTPPR
jgi:hypothetical protein